MCIRDSTWNGQKSAQEYFTDGITASVKGYDYVASQNHIPVSYTHLDVYKRQQSYRYKGGPGSWKNNLIVAVYQTEPSNG